MFFGNRNQRQQPPSPVSSEEVSTDNDWEHIPTDCGSDEDVDVVDEPVPLLLDPSFEIIEDEILAEEDDDELPEDTSHGDCTQRDQILMTMEALVQNGRTPNDKWTTYLCVLSIAALLFGVSGGCNKTHPDTLQVPAAVVVEDLKPFPIYDAYVAMPQRMEEPVVSPDAKFEGIKSHEKQQQQAVPTATPADYVAFVAAQAQRQVPNYDYATFVSLSCQLARKVSQCLGRLRCALFQGILAHPLADIRRGQDEHHVLRQ